MEVGGIGWPVHVYCMTTNLRLGNAENSDELHCFLKCEHTVVKVWIVSKTLLALYVLA
jgi:hypothetical protein